jgi:hypothetical protein
MLLFGFHPSLKKLFGDPSLNLNPTEQIEYFLRRINNRLPCRIVVLFPCLTNTQHIILYIDMTKMEKMQSLATIAHYLCSIGDDLLFTGCVIYIELVKQY